MGVASCLKTKSTPSPTDLTGAEVQIVWAAGQELTSRFGDKQ